MVDIQVGQVQHKYVAKICIRFNVITLCKQDFESLDIETYIQSLQLYKMELDRHLKKMKTLLSLQNVTTLKKNLPLYNT